MRHELRMISLVAVIATNWIASSVAYSFSPFVAKFLPCRHRSLRSTIHGLSMNEAIGVLEKPASRGHMLLHKYQGARGLVLPRLSDEEEAFFPKEVPIVVAQSGAAEKTTETAKLAATRVDSAPKKARVFTPEEQRALDEKQGRVERDRSKQLHGYDGGWWAKPSPYLGTKDGGTALIAVPKDQLRNPEEEAQAALEAEVRSAMDQAKALIWEAVRGDEALARSLIQLGWADAITFSDLGERTFGPRTGSVFRIWIQRKWPRMFGSNGSIRFQAELSLACNRGAAPGLELVERVRAAVPSASYADLIQLAFAQAVKALGGPEVELVYGRCDAGEEHCAPAAQFPAREALADPVQDLRQLFMDRCGFTEDAMLALCAPGLLGFGFANPALSGPGRSGPFVALVSAPQYADKMKAWSQNPSQYLAAYAAAHRRLSELGAKLVLPKGVPAVAKPAKQTNLIVGWGGLGVHYDKETVLDSGMLDEAEAAEATAGQVPWRSGLVAAVYDEQAAKARAQS